MKQVQRGRYEHYKGKYYEVIGTATHSETKEELVVYRALYDVNENGEHTLWVRPRSMFTEDVYAEGKTVPRFRLVEAY